MSSPNERDIVQEATARAEKRNEGSRHSKPKGYRSHPREKHMPREHRVASTTEPNSKAEAALRAMGAAGPLMPPRAAASATEDEEGDVSPPASTAGNGMAERASEGVAGAIIKPVAKFVEKAEEEEGEGN